MIYDFHYLFFLWVAFWRRLDTRLWMCLIFVIISDAVILKLKIAVSEEIQIYVAELIVEKLKEYLI